MFTEMCFVTGLFVFVCLAERVTLLPFGALTFWQARKTMKMCDLGVDHLRELKNLLSQRARTLREYIHCFQVDNFAIKLVTELMRKLPSQIVDRSEFA